ncbi:hypothetical protein Tco_0690970 [Tanacetum coccineum]
MMRGTEVHKFSNGTLMRILEKLDHMVKDYMLFKFNPGMEHRIWSEYDKRRSKEFIENQRDLPKDNPLVSEEVLRYDIKRSKSENKGIVLTEMELVLVKTQQGTSHEVSGKGAGDLNVQGGDSHEKSVMGWRKIKRQCVGDFVTKKAAKRWVQIVELDYE